MQNVFKIATVQIKIKQNNVVENYLLQMQKQRCSMALAFRKTLMGLKLKMVQLNINVINNKKPLRIYSVKQMQNVMIHLAVEYHLVKTNTDLKIKFVFLSKL